jgi:hypothetical protein
MTKLRNRGYIEEDILDEATASGAIPIEKLQAMMRKGKHIEAMKILATRAGATKTAKKLDLIAQLKAVEEDRMPYELENYYNIVRRDLMAFLKEKIGKEKLRDILPIV